MRLTRLYTKGLKGLSQFPTGIDFNFDALPDGLIAVVGANGAGKSTFLEAPFAGLFGTFPSRPDCVLMDSVDGRDACIDVQVAIDGRGTYRARVNIDGVKRVTDAVLELTRPDGGVERLNDGKISTFKTAIAQALPSLPLLLASAFAAQNKAGSFAKLDKRERRDLFAKLLGLERYEQMATACRAAALLVDKALIAQRALLVRLRLETTDALGQALEATGQSLQAEFATVRTQRGILEPALAELTQQIDDLRRRDARYMAADGELAQLRRRHADQHAGVQQLTRDRQGLDVDETREIATAEARRDHVLANHQRAIDALPSALQLDVALTHQVDAIDRQRDALIADTQKRIDNNRTLLDRGDAIRAAVAEARSIQASLDEHQRLITEAARTRLTADRDRTKAGDVLRAAERAKEQRDQLTRTAGLLADVPCAGADPFTGCQFLQDARSAQSRLATLGHVDEAYETASRAHFQAIASVTAIDEQVAAYAQAMVELRTRLAVLTPEAERLARLEAAETRVAELTAEQETLRQRAEQDRATARTKRHEAGQVAAGERERLQVAMLGERTAIDLLLTDVRARYTEKRRDLDGRAQQITEDLATLDTQIAALETVKAENASAHTALVTAEARAQELRRQWDDSTHQLAGVQQQLATFDRRRAAFETAQAEATRLEALVTQLETDQIEWEAFARVFGREGLPNLEIDAAGPGVSALANDLLQACFGSRFTVELLTQDVKADGKGMKEIFELRVWDAERGGEARELQLLSGGEQVIVDEAVRAAVALFINQRNDLPIRTIFRDETTGALDPENALRYVAMLRRLLERSGASKLLFITHAPEAAALADAQIVFGSGALTVQYPPFATPIDREAA